MADLCNSRWAFVSLEENFAVMEECTLHRIHLLPYRCRQPLHMRTQNDDRVKVDDCAFHHVYPLAMLIIKACVSNGRILFWQSLPPSNSIDSSVHDTDNTPRTQCSAIILTIQRFILAPINTFIPNPNPSSR